MSNHSLSEAFRETVLTLVLACALAPAAFAQGTAPPEQSNQEQRQEEAEAQTEAQEPPEEFKEEITVTGTRVEGQYGSDAIAGVLAGRRCRPVVGVSEG